MSDPLELATYFANRGQADAANKAAKRKPKRATAVEWHGYDADLGRHLIKLPGMSEPKPIGSTLTSGGLTVGQSVDGAQKGQAIAVDGLPGRRPQRVEEGRRSTQVKWAIAFSTCRVTGQSGTDLANAKAQATVWYLDSLMDEPIAVWSDTKDVIDSAEVGVYREVFYDGGGLLILVEGAQQSPVQHTLSIIGRNKAIVEVCVVYSEGGLEGVEEEADILYTNQIVLNRYLIQNGVASALPGFQTSMTRSTVFTPPSLPNQVETTYSEYFLNDFDGLGAIPYAPAPPNESTPTEQQNGPSIRTPEKYWRNASRRFPNFPSPPLPPPPINGVWRSPDVRGETVIRGSIYAAQLVRSGGEKIPVNVTPYTAVNGIQNQPLQSLTLLFSEFIEEGGGRLEVWRLRDRYIDEEFEGEPLFGTRIPGTVAKRVKFDVASQPKFFETLGYIAPGSGGINSDAGPMQYGGIPVLDLILKVALF